MNEAGLERLLLALRGDRGRYNPRYLAVHKKLIRFRGHASEHTCPCGAQAQEWAFDESSGFSRDLARYTPMCAPCHARLDGGT